jgi:hypothetical protein
MEDVGVRAPAISDQTGGFSCMTPSPEPLYRKNGNAQPKETKICNHDSCSFAGIQQPLDNFTKNPRKSDGLDAWCKTCRATYARQKKDIYAKQRAESVPDPLGKKICTGELCIHNGTLQPLSNFYVNSYRKDGLTDQCKDCCKKRATEWHDNNLEKHRENAKKWYEENKERQAEYKKKWYEKNSTSIKEKSRTYHHKTKEANKEKKQAYQANHKEERRLAHQEWHRTHWEFIATKRCKQRAERKGIPFNMKPADLLPLPEFCPIFR